MPHINDLIYSKLSDQLGTDGNVDDLLHKWLVTEIGIPTASSLNDLWEDYLVNTLSVPLASLNDMQETWLSRLGYTGTLDDMWLQFWDTYTLVILNWLLISINTPTISTGLPTFTRATTGTYQRVSDDVYVVAAIDEARFEAAGILMEPTSTNKVTAYSTPGDDQLDSEELTNGDFVNWTGDNPDNWGVQEVGDATSNVTESPAGSCRIISDGTQTRIWQATQTVGLPYEVVIDVTINSGAGIEVRGGTSVTHITETGTYTFPITQVANTNFYIYARTGIASDTSVNSVSVKAIGGTDSSDESLVTGLGTLTKSTAANNVVPGITITGHANAVFNVITDAAGLRAAGLGEIGGVVDVPEYELCLAFGDSFANNPTDYPAQLNEIALGTIVTHGIPGALLTGAILANFEDDITADDYTCAIIQGGINDIMSDVSAADMLAAVQGAYTIADNLGVSVILVGLAPWKTANNYTAARQVVTDDYNALALDFAVTNGIPFIDVYNPMEGAVDQLFLPYDSGDALHPSENGFNFYAHLIHAQMGEGGKIYRMFGASAGDLATIAGVTGNTNTHSSRFFLRSHLYVMVGNSPGFGTNRVVYTTDQPWHEATITGTPEGAGDQLYVRTDTNSYADFLVLQLEEQPAITSPMLTNGAAEPRGADENTLQQEGNHNQEVGMLRLDVTFGGDAADFTTEVGVYGLRDNVQSLLSYDGTNLKATDGTNTATLALAVVAGTTYKIAVGWSSSGLQITADGSSGTNQSYDGAFEIDGNNHITLTYGTNIPINIKYIKEYDVEKGQSWREISTS